jgi:cyanophycin synthetase
MELLDSRRLTGPNILSDRPGAVIDVRLEPAETATFVAAWRDAVRHMLEALGWADRELHVRHVSGGVSLGFDAPIDLLYAATEINDWAFEAARTRLEAGQATSLAESAQRIGSLIGEESNPPLTALAQAAREKGIPFLSDDDHVSLGLGRFSRTWAARAVPPPSEVPWDGLDRIPVGLVTGTNGKTTTVRMAAAMASAAGSAVGLTSTDRIVVNGQTVEEGDYAGPGGARKVLRDPLVDIAILETARGGLLRRGAALERADACVITNVAPDHLDDFGVRDLESLADVKWIVTRVLGNTGTAILNAEDPRLLQRAAGLSCRITWFALDPAAVPRAGGSKAFVLDGEYLSLTEGGNRLQLIHVTEVPLAVGGAARHNVANCLAAMGLADALGVPVDAIVRAARETTDAANPGRCNIFRIRGASVVVDFAHNPDGVRALQGIPDGLGCPGRRLVMIGQAGDRGDEAIRQLARATCGLRPDRLLIKEMARYSRGRPEGEVAGILRAAFLASGLAPEHISHVRSEMDGVRQALEWLEPGDIAVLLVHENIAAVTELLRAESSAQSKQEP